MKKFFRFLVPFLLVIAILGSLAWYLFVYDRGFTQDILLHTARHLETSGSHKTAAWLYDLAYKQSGNDQEVAIELAEQFKAIGNYSKAEYTLSNAIANGGTAELYVALCKTYVEQDKLLDAVEMLDKISNPEIKAELDARRPAAPTADLAPGFYSQYYDVTVTAESGHLYLTTDGEYPSTADGVHPGKVSLPGGETTLKAVAVADDGLVSPLSIYGYIIGGVIEKVEFADSAVEQAIRQLLSLDEDTIVYTDNLWDITEFTVPEGTKDYSDLKLLPYLTELTIEKGEFEDVKFLSDMPHLEKLKITGSSLSGDDLETISKMPNLKDLNLSDCSLSSIAPLSSAQSLVRIDLSGNTIRNIDALSSMVSLEYINLKHNALTSLDALSGLSALKTLDVSYNALTSIAPVCSIPTLNVLEATDNDITGLEGVDNLKNLTCLYVGYNKLTDISPVAGCSSLKELDISNNEITDIDALAALVNVTDFNFSYNKVTSLPAFAADCALTIIDGSYNALTDLEELRDLPNLNRVNMDYNAELSDISCLAECHVLVQVNVFGTKVSDVSSLTERNIVVNYDPTAAND